MVADGFASAPSPFSDLVPPLYDSRTPPGCNRFFETSGGRGVPSTRTCRHARIDGTPRPPAKFWQPSGLLRANAMSTMLNVSQTICRQRPNFSETRIIAPHSCANRSPQSSTRWQPPKFGLLNSEQPGGLPELSRGSHRCTCPHVHRCDPRMFVRMSCTLEGCVNRRVEVPSRKTVRELTRTRRRPKPT